MLYIEPVSPRENGCIESFNGHLDGGEGSDRAVQSDLQSHQDSKFARVPAASAGDPHAR